MVIVARIEFQRCSIDRGILSWCDEDGEAMPIKEQWFINDQLRKQSVFWQTR